MTITVPASDPTKTGLSAKTSRRTAKLGALALTETRLLTRDWTLLVFAFLFPPFTMLVLAGVFGSEPDDGFAMRRPDDYYVAASTGVSAIALGLIGLPVALASYRERGVLRRFEAFGVSTARVVAAQAAVTWGLMIIAVALVLAVAAPTYGISVPEHPWQVLLGFVAGSGTLVLLGVAIGLAVPTARAAQAVGLMTFFPLYLLGGGGPPRTVMTSTMRSISDALPSIIPAIVDPWLGIASVGDHLIPLTAWAVVALAAILWLTRRPRT
ncbi:MULTISPECIES: ABC transporter permease [Pseudofrankia]|uniref:ABC transporter permease n=1 Tax=Pseudofrankia TaxID=2994363 RepID=UPI000234D539|nr:MULTISPECIES: ABC transporter permease [Pseudofrankia]